MARRTKEEAEQTRLQILEAAFDLFIERGYELTTVDQIAERIGFSKGAVYWHFKSKADILIDLMTEAARDYQNLIARQSREEPSSLNELMEYVVSRARRILTRERDRKLFVMLNRVNWDSPRMEMVKDRMRVLQVDIFSLLRMNLIRFLEEGILPKTMNLEKTVNVLGAIWLEPLRAKLCVGVDLDVEETIRYGFGLVLSAISKR